VNDSRGPVDVPVAPTRPVALVGSAEIDMIALGLTPVFSGAFATGWVDLAPETITSSLVPPDPEQVAATRPDLLLGWDWLAEDTAWNEVRDLAPLVTLPSGNDWRKVFELVADAVNRQERGAALLAAYDARIAKLRSTYAPKRISLNMVGVFEPGTFWWWDAPYPANAHLTAAGFDVRSPAETAKGVSLERLTELTADWLIVSAPKDDKDGLAKKLVEHPLAKKLPSVANGRVHIVDRDLWGGAGLMWANALLDDIERLYPA
jgi:iron complex transport system substrate-binding protein